MRFLALILLFAASVQGANVHVRPSADVTFDGDGTTWASAASGGAAGARKGMPSTLTRGNDYYLADGSYSSYTFDDSNSGTTRISVIKATEAAHGSATGWSSGFGDGRAVFTTLVFGNDSNNGGYYTIDGVNGGGPDDWECANCGIEISEIAMEKFVDNNANSIIIQHVEVDVGESGPSDVRGMELYASDGFQLRYCYIHDSGCDMISMNVMNDFLMEYCKVARNRQAEPGCHGDLIEYQIGDASNFTIRYNFFEDIVGSYAFGSHDPTITGYYIYGNIFYWTEEPFFGNYLVGCLSSTGVLVDMKFINNTLIGAITSDAHIGFGILRGSGHEAYNNIFYVPVDNNFSISWSSTTHGSNTAYNGDGSSAEQNLTGNPFVSYPTNLELSSDATAGTDKSAYVTVDANGDAYNADGDWDRGALAFGDGGDVAAPTLSSATIPTGGTTITLAFNESVSVGAGGNGGWSITMSGGAVTMSYASGSGSSSLVYNLNRTVNSGETGDVDYTQPGSGIEDGSGNDLANVTNASVTNNSSQGGAGTPGAVTLGGATFSLGGATITFQ